MKEENAEEKDRTEASSGGEDQEKEAPKTGSAFEGIYDRMPDISVRALDRFIAACVIALIAVVLIGILRANHVF